MTPEEAQKQTEERWVEISQKVYDLLISKREELIAAAKEMKNERKL